MKASDFVSELRHDDIVAAVQKAEKKTSGEIRVFITRHEIKDPVEAAKAEFAALKMDQTRDHNGILIFVAPQSRNFAVIGDKGIHDHCGQDFWNQVSHEMGEYFRRGEFSQGIIAGVTKVGDLLSVHFPYRPDDKNELPDKVEQD
jgi:uncharacterized membrane protein